MPQFEQDREDILREATALVERVELLLPGRNDPVVVGFRRDGSASFYFGTEFVIQFNDQRELRRAYDQGRMLKAARGRLVALRRVREAQQVTLLSQELPVAETAEFSQRTLALLASLRTTLQQGEAQITGQFPAECDVVGRVQTWLDDLQAEVTIANRPNVSGR